MRTLSNMVPKTGGNYLLTVGSPGVSRHFTSLFYSDFMTIALITVGAALVSIEKTIGYMTVSSGPNVASVLYVLQKNYTTPYHALYSFSLLDCNTSEGIIRPEI